MGGKNALDGLVVDLATGSSPRGRGKHNFVIGHGSLARLIPAWAGKTPEAVRHAHARRAHPRVGGENRPVVQGVVAGGGSSPRGRGKLEVPVIAQAVTGLIPAWAGKTIFSQPADTLIWAHPRVGGENAPVQVGADLIEGSSPRGRGKPVTGPAVDSTTGLIPAWAGKTLPDLRFYRADRSDLGNPWACRLFWKLLIFGRLRN